jgi:hypothetical protein
MPHTYLLAKKYVKTGVIAVLHHDERVGREFQKAYAEFKSIFEEKTGINWDQRLNKLQQEKGSYTYTPPSGGKPVGLIPFRPSGCKKSEQSVEQVLDGTGSSPDGIRDYHMTDPDLVDDTDSGDDDN